MLGKKQNTSDQIVIRSIKKEETSDKKLRVNVLLDNGRKSSVLWYEFDKTFEPYLCIDRCDAVITTIFLAAMKHGYKTIKTDYPISEKLYYNLTYHAIPQLFDCGQRRISRLHIDAPLTKESFNGNINATGMSRGVDSFATMYEYGKRMEMADYRVNLFTYFQVGAHHGLDPFGEASTESKQELYENQMKKTREFCNNYGYPLLVVESNVNDVLANHEFFSEWSFDRTHTCRNLGIATLFQKGIHRYYYSSTYTLSEFHFSLEVDMADYEKWLIPLLDTGSIEFFSSNQEWTRMEKVEKIAEVEECHDFLQVCLVKSGNCGKCLKCKRTLLELDALGGDVLDRFAKSFDIEKYKREDRQKWFSNLLAEKDKSNNEAHYYEDVFVCAAKNHPELLGSFIQNVDKDVESVVVQYGILNIRELPSRKSALLDVRKKGDILQYLGNCGEWIAVRLENGQDAYVVKKGVFLSGEKYKPAPESSYRYAVVSAERVNLREFPGIHSLVIGFGNKGDCFRFRRDLGAWVAVYLSDGRTAYALKHTVELSDKRIRLPEIRTVLENVMSK